jgi:signal transduction histidine kinase
VHVIAAAEGGGAVLRVRDNGPGIPPEKQPYIFDRFERADAQKDISGLGLGLYITRQIVEMHAGKIRVDSRDGQGAEFVVELPAGLTAAAPAKPSRQTTPSVTAVPPPEPTTATATAV